MRGSIAAIAAPAIGASGAPAAQRPKGQDTCTEPGLDPVHNYMDYSDDPCYTEFTSQQRTRIAQQWLADRAG